MNNVSLVGRLTRDVTITDTKKGKGAFFTIAVDENKDHTDFIPVSYYLRNAGNLADYIHKGSSIDITGSITSYTKEVNGQKTGKLIVNARRIQFLEKKPAEKEAIPVSNDYENEDFTDPAITEDGIPDMPF